jgi:hypothetical protein
MLNYATNGVSNVFYFERLSYLLKFFDIDNWVVNCACNISTFIAKVLAEAPSVTEKNTCAQCHYKEIKNIPIAEINTKPICAVRDGRIVQGARRNWFLCSTDIFNRIQFTYTIV